MFICSQLSIACREDTTRHWHNMWNERHPWPAFDRLTAGCSGGFKFLHYFWQMAMALKVICPRILVRFWIVIGEYGGTPPSTNAGYGIDNHIGTNDASR